jgi:aminopeptidase N
LNVDSIKFGNTSLSYVHTSDHKLNITLDRNYSVGEEFEVKIFYQGVPSSSGFGSFTFGSRHGFPSIYTLSEPYGSSDWWACKDTPADKVDSSDVWVTCDENLYAVSNGNLIEIVNNSNSTKTFKWKNSHPIAHYLISLAISNYHIYYNYFNYSQADSMPVIHYIYPDTFANVQSELDKTVEMIEVFSDRFGSYPFLNEKYGHAQFGWGGGMENQTVTSLGAFSEGIISHELAHQWYGDKITCRDWHHIWLNEGFATYATGVYFEYKYGSEGYQQYINTQMSGARNALGSIYVRDITDINQIFDGPRTYSKGACVLHMLRGILGDSVFFNILRAYASHPSVSYGTATTEDFQAIAESVCGSNLNYFFQQWIYGEMYPKYNFNWVSEQFGNGYELKLNISQETNTSPQFFTMPVQIKITTTSGDTLLTIFNDQQVQQFIFSLESEPLSVVFDPNNWILKDLTITSDVDENIPEFSFLLQQNYPNPFNPSTKIKYTVNGNEFNTSPVNVQLKVYDVLGNEITTLVNEYQSPGNYEVEFSSSENVASGVYYYQITAGDFTSTKKMILLR